MRIIAYDAVVAAIVAIAVTIQALKRRLTKRDDLAGRLVLATWKLRLERTATVGLLIAIAILRPLGAPTVVPLLFFACAILSGWSSVTTQRYLVRMRSGP